MTRRTAWGVARSVVLSALAWLVLLLGLALLWLAEPGRGLLKRAGRLAALGFEARQGRRFPRQGRRFPRQGRRVP